VALTSSPNPAESSQPAMNLTTWLAGESAELAKLSADCLLAVRQFEWVQASMPIIEPESSEPVSPDERAQRIIELVTAYQDASQADPAAAEALRQLGSFMVAMGCPAEAWECLGQASATYNQLAQSLLPEISRLDSQPLHVQEQYFAYRAAGLAALAQAAAVAVSSPAWPDTKILLLGEIQAKLDQIHRHWSELGGQGSLAAMLSSADHALQIVQDLDSAGAYEFPRMRFWWWYYPAEEPSRRVPASSRQGERTGRGSSRVSKFSERPKLQYTQPSLQKQPRSPRGRGRRTTQPQR